MSKIVSLMATEETGKHVSMTGNAQLCDKYVYIIIYYTRRLLSSLLCIDVYVYIAMLWRRSSICFAAMWLTNEREKQ